MTIVIRLLFTGVLAYLAAFGSRWWLFAALMLFAAGMEAQQWVIRQMDHEW